MCLPAEIKLTWNAVTGASSYTVKRSTTSGAGYSTVGTANASSYKDTGLTEGTRYYYKVSAVIGDEAAPNSREASALPAQSETVLFSDGFESGDLSGWKASDWLISSGKKNSGSYSAVATEGSGYLYKKLNISSYSQVTISFYYRDVGVDDDDQAFFRLFDGTDYDPIFELGNTDPEGALAGRDADVEAPVVGSYDWPGVTLTSKLPSWPTGVSVTGSSASHTTTQAVSAGAVAGSSTVPVTRPAGWSVTRRAAASRPAGPRSVTA